ncbi:family 20 glycosylhydrolase [Agromyces intestinalis]|uniref:beta-N-acetylhexosaminidase n=1 Tax=Agromyces intestinalis TaxID=2592652 RepID=A0A5C1YDK4_9MICO|nr:family 20 glycosylhydrolase [Agromyces intestinalis]QEO14156.1 family 20 glycosylhydrolase [Agromyces intestinalis]
MTHLAAALRFDGEPAYAWRGVLLDVARRFRPLPELRRLVDLLAAHGLNVLQLHLTDDQGWRIEVRAFPRLAEVGGRRSQTQLGHGPDATLDGVPHTGWYTQGELRELVAYAAARGIRIVPEVDLPGHATAILAAYPEFGVGGAEAVRARVAEPWTRFGVSDEVLNVEESTVAFACAVLDEVCDVFDSDVIGIGGDEVRKERWHDDARTQQLMHERGLVDERELQAWFLGRVAAHLAARGRRVLGWDEMLEGADASRLPGDAIVASWRGPVGAELGARLGHDVLLCPDLWTYLDYRQSDDPCEPIPVGTVLALEDVASFDPLAGASAVLRSHVVGVQANVWCEHLDSRERFDYAVFPRLGAFAEVAWNGGPLDWDSFTERLPGYLAWLESRGVDFRPLDGPRPDQQRPGVPGMPRDRASRLAELARLTADLR